MGAHGYIIENFQKAYAGKEDFAESQRKRILQWRREPTIVRLEKPTNPARARELGYKAKQGFVIVRVRVRKGSGHKTRPDKGRRPKRMGVLKLKRSISKQRIAEERVARRFRNLEVLNSYYVGEDGQHLWYEIILVDPHHPAIINDKDVSWIVNHRGRAFRGLTSAGKKGRGLRKKGKGTEKIRPSIRANQRKGK